ncbi:MAG TPA: VWA domain-containing protein [Pyrinomonadaceae bacterium]|nr:VWA domain-containing protein [Pyrinomonadaceae bacterium]
MRGLPLKSIAWFAAALVVALPALAGAQAGRRTAAVANVERSATINVVASRADGSASAVSAKDLALYDGGIEQTIQGFSQDPSPARILILVDNSLSLRADVEKLTQATREFAYEIYDGDKVMIVGYDEVAEVIVGWTDDAKEIEKSLTLFRKKGDPHLFDALRDVMSAELQPLGITARKRAIVLVADGLDRGSKAKFPDVLAELQKQDITVYALQIPDRTGGALRRDRPKPNQVIQQLVDGTGGRILSVEQPGEAAKSICDELRKNRYVLSYTPASVSYYDNRRLLLVGPEGVEVRAKAQQPAHIVIR